VHGHLATAAAAAVLSAGFVAAAEPVTIPLLRRAAAIDTPNLRSSHTVPTPRGGGAPIAIALVLAAALLPASTALIFGAAVAVFAAMGLADDLRGLPARGRLAMQAAAGLAAGGLLAHAAGLPPAAAVGAAVAIAAWITGFVNAFNFMDGVNGISGAHAVVGGACYAGLGLWHADPLLAAGGAAVAAGAAAFLPWNAIRARVFLGDVGSYALGAALAVLAASAVVLAGLPPEAALGPLALYLADTAWTLQRRIRAGEPWLLAHRTHAYQRLTDAGWSHQRVTAATAALTAVLSLLGAVSLTPGPLARTAADLAGLALLAAYLRAPAWLGHPAPAALASTVPASAVPASAVPASPVPASPVPASAVPASPVPASAVPASAVPASAVPAATGPGSTVPVPWPVPAVPAPRPAQAPAPAAGELIAGEPAAAAPGSGAA
jgi:UDP-N-acetylmuramyl pentapeptide phosphotransferase/UDP-N-acetylglucosamine-1-phosphate transferase